MQPSGSFQPHTPKDKSQLYDVLASPRSTHRGIGYAQLPETRGYYRADTVPGVYVAPDFSRTVTAGYNVDNLLCHPNSVRDSFQRRLMLAPQLLRAR